MLNFDVLPAKFREKMKKMVVFGRLMVIAWLAWLFSRSKKWNTHDNHVAIARDELVNLIFFSFLIFLDNIRLNYI